LRVLHVVWSPICLVLHFILWAFHFIISRHSSSSVWFLFIVITDVIIYLTVYRLNHAILVYLFLRFELLRLFVTLLPKYGINSWNLDVANVPSWTHGRGIRHSWIVWFPCLLETLTSSIYLHWSVIINMSWWEDVVVLFVLLNVLAPEASWRKKLFLQLLRSIDIAKSSRSLELILVFFKVHFSNRYSWVYFLLLLELVDSRVEARILA